MVKLLSGGNPQIPKDDAKRSSSGTSRSTRGGNGTRPRRLDVLIEHTVPDVETTMSGRSGTSTKNN